MDPDSGRVSQEVNNRIHGETWLPQRFVKTVAAMGLQGEPQEVRVVNPITGDFIFWTHVQTGFIQAFLVRNTDCRGATWGSKSVNQDPDLEKF